MNKMAAENDKVQSNMSVVTRPRQSTWPALPMNEALAFVENMEVPRCVKYIPVAAVRVGQVLAERVVAKENVPEVRTSIKDGYAVLASDPPGERRVIGSSTAGAPFLGTVSAGECVRVSTGAFVPDGADAVAMVENTRLIKHDGVEELIISVDTTVKPGQDI
ncbi:MoeA region, partial [Ancylostoma duodenale]